MSLADPLTLESFRADPVGTGVAADLSDDLVKLLVSSHAGAIRVRGVQELEPAGLALMVSDKF